MTVDLGTEWKKLAPKTVVPHPVTASGGAVKLVVLHHSVTPDAAFLDMLLSIERYHHGKAYYDFAYNGAASNSSDESADGRGPVVQGGATGNGVDAHSLSIVAIGDFQSSGKDVPADRLVENVARKIVGWVELGHVAPDFKLEPHRLHYSTSCCGDRLVRRIPEIVERVAEILGGVADMVAMMSEWDEHYRSLEVPSEPDGIVEWFQDELSQLGFYTNAVDGVKGGATVAAWLSFEESQGWRNANELPGNFSVQRMRELVKAKAAAATVEVVPDDLVDAVAATAMAASAAVSLL